MATPVGPLIVPPNQYTHCVDRSAYKDVPGFWDAGFGAIAEFLLCEYLLGGKLVCLAGGGDECALGVIVGIEEVGYQKTFRMQSITTSRSICSCCHISRRISPRTAQLRRRRSSTRTQFGTTWSTTVRSVVC